MSCPYHRQVWKTFLLSTCIVLYFLYLLHIYSINTAFKALFMYIATVEEVRDKYQSNTNI